MNHLKTLIALQLKDKVDLSWVKEFKKAFRVIIFGIIKFILLAGVTYGVLYIAKKLSIFDFDQSPMIVILVLFISLLLSLISCTFELMKSLYFSEDNKVLITLPVNTNQIFISKLIVYYIYEFKKSFSFLIPITVGCCTLLVLEHLCNPFMFIWMWIPLIFIIAIPVLFGAILSIPMMYIYRFIKKHGFIKVLLLLIGIGLFLWLAIYLFKLIPESISIKDQWNTIKIAINNFLMAAEKKLFVFSHLMYLVIGYKKEASFYYTFSIQTLITFSIVIAICALSFFIVYFVSRPLFFGMMSKSFEMNKKENNLKRNHFHGKYFTFINKEFIINIRTLNISFNYLVVYLLVPVLLLFFNKLLGAMNLGSIGIKLIYTFNILLILLPLLASNALVATYYSREGRSAYLKKTKPIHAFFPLLAKLCFNILFALPTIVASAFVFGFINNINYGYVAIFALFILFVHIGHMFYSATLDIMNPQNEQYATTGDIIDNPNENKSTIMAFVISLIFTLIAFKLFDEAFTNSNFLVTYLKLFIIGLIYAISCIVMFNLKIKAYYYDIQGR